MKEISAKEINDNLIKAISDEWMLITAGNADGYNTMTASWGFVGEMWGEDSVAVMVRPQRYTMEFIEKNDRFTLSFYGDRKDIHKVCGYKSGRNTDKAAECGLTPAFEDGTVYFKQARLVMVCKKQYMSRLEEKCFIDKEPLKWYPEKDYHNMIIGKIEKVLISD